MISASEDYAMLTARASYSIAGHAEGGALVLVPVSGLDGSIVIDLSAARARREEARKSDVNRD